MKPVCTCLSHKEGLMISNWSEKIKTPLYCQENHKFEKDVVRGIVFNSSGPVVQVPYPSSHTVTGRFYKNSVQKKMKEFYNKKRPSKGWSGVHLLHDNASSHKCEVVKSFLASEKVKVLNHPPYSADLSPCDFFLFPRLKKSIRLEVFLAALFISVSNRYQKKTIYLLFATG